MMVALSQALFVHQSTMRYGGQSEEWTIQGGKTWGGQTVGGENNHTPDNQLIQIGTQYSFLSSYLFGMNFVDKKRLRFSYLANKSLRILTSSSAEHCVDKAETIDSLFKGTVA